MFPFATSGWEIEGRFIAQTVRLLRTPLPASFTTTPLEAESSDCRLWSRQSHCPFNILFWPLFGPFMTPLRRLLGVWETFSGVLSGFPVFLGVVVAPYWRLWAIEPFVSPF